VSPTVARSSPIGASRDDLRKEVAGRGIAATLIEPGTVDTPLVSGAAEGRRVLARYRSLESQDVARGVAFALSQPPHVDIDELMISPRGAAP